MKVGNLVCCKCGSDDVMVVSPGNEGEKHELVGLLGKPVPVRAWCARCWPNAQEPRE